MFFKISICFILYSTSLKRPLHIASYVGVAVLELQGSEYLIITQALHFYGNYNVCKRSQLLILIIL